MRYFLSSSENGIFNSVAIFTFVIPKPIHLLTSSKLTPEAPCNTNGTDTLLDYFYTHVYFDFVHRPLVFYCYSYCA